MVHFIRNRLNTNGLQSYLCLSYILVMFNLELIALCLQNVITDMSEITNINKYLDDKCSINDLGVLKYILGIEVMRTPKRIMSKEVCFRFSYRCYLACSPLDTPMSPKHKLTEIGTPH